MPEDRMRGPVDNEPSVFLDYMRALGFPVGNPKPERGPILDEEGKTVIDPATGQPFTWDIY